MELQQRSVEFQALLRDHDNMRYVGQLLDEYYRTVEICMKFHHHQTKMISFDTYILIFGTVFFIPTDLLDVKSMS